MAEFKLRNLDNTISTFISHKEYCEAKEIQHKKLIDKLFDKIEGYKIISEKNESVCKVEYRDYTILIIYGIYNDAFGMILKNENPICTLNLKITVKEVIEQGIEKISFIHGNFFPEFDVE